jgi:phage shock protein A
MAYWVSKAEEFRARAAECEEKANQAKDAGAKRLLREAAETWRGMATQVERLGG